MARRVSILLFMGSGQIVCNIPVTFKKQWWHLFKVKTVAGWFKSSMLIFAINYKSSVLTWCRIRDA